MVGLAFVISLGTAEGTAAAAPPAPALVGSVSNATTLSGALGIAVSGHYAYTTAYWPGQLTAVDISNPAAPRVVGSTSSNATQLENGSTVTISGIYAFVVSKNRNLSTSSNDNGTGNSLTIVNISNPAAPAVIGTIQSSTELFGAYGIAVQGSYAYVSYQGVLPGQPQTPDTSTGGFSVINITNPGGPAIVANLDNGSLPAPYTNLALDHPTSVALYSHYAYVTAFYGDRLTVIDIANPTSPSVVDSLPDANKLVFSNYVTISGADAYIAAQTGTGGFQLIDVSLANPARPTIVGSLSDPSLLAGAYRVRVRGDFAYVAASSANTVAAIDVSNPAAPRVAAAITDPSHLHRASDLDIDSSGRYVIATSPQETSETSPNLYPPFSDTTGTISVIDLIPNPIAVPISSEPPKRTKATSASFAFATDDTLSTVACRLDSAAYGSCTSSTSQSYSGLLPGRHTFSVRATDAAGNTSTSSYTWAIDAAPKAVKRPSLSAGTVLGLTLRANGTWTGYPTLKFHYQWLRCNRHAQHCKAISGAKHSAYTPGTKDLGFRLELRVTASNSLGTVKKTTAASPVVGQAVKATLAVSGGTVRLKLTVTDPVPKAALRRITITLPRGVTINGKRTVTLGGHGTRHSIRLTYVLRGAVSLARGLTIKYIVADSSGAHVRAPLLVR